VTLLTRVKTWLWEPTPRIQMLPAYMILGIGGFAVMGQFVSLSNQRIEDAEEEALQREYITCVSRVNTRDALRGVLLGITELFPPDDGQVAAVTELIETEYPALDIHAECDSLREEAQS
jgi:hypothetical protein